MWCLFPPYDMPGRGVGALIAGIYTIEHSKHA